MVATRSGGTVATEPEPATWEPSAAQYLSATSSYWESGKPQGEYGIFVSNTTGPGRIAHTYASNMADSGYYVGACPDCNTVLDDAHAQYYALGYSGTNSGGHLIIKNSEFDQNKTGVTHQQPEQRRRAITAGRHLSRQRLRTNGHALVLDVHPQLRARQQQRQCAR